MQTGQVLEITMNINLDKIYSERSESILKNSKMDPHPVCST